MQTDPHIMDELSKGAFAPIYPVIANQITAKTGIKEGICIDIGAGPASLSIALAKITNLKIYAMDISKESYYLSKKNIKIEGLVNRIIPIVGDVHQLPFADEFSDLIISRGSLPFWKDISTAFKEINRVLKPDASGYIGGGFGSHELKEEISKELMKNTSNNNFYHPPKIDINTLESAVKKAVNDNYIIINDDSGLWVIIKKIIYD
jgi:ubiquinone/menaquinone biosynthesis C-methylase UbiE